MKTIDERIKLRRFVRRPIGEELTLTPRRASVLRDLDQFRFMHTRHFQALYGERAARDCLYLFRHGLIDRPKAQRPWRALEGGGSRPLAYALTNAGRSALARIDGIETGDRRDLNELNRNLSSLSSYIPHEIELADVYVAFRRAVMAVSGLTLMQFTNSTNGGHIRSLEVPGGTTVEPDWLFAASKAEGEPCGFSIEHHRCTEPNERFQPSNLQHLVRKYTRYLSYTRAMRHASELGVRRFRVLTITTGGERNVRNIAAKAGELCGGVGADRFLVARFEDVLAHGPLAPIWRNAMNETRTLKL